MNMPRGPRYKQLPHWPDASRFLVEVEQAVRQFPRYHKYTLGSELRRQAMAICRLVARAAQSNAIGQRERLLEQWVWQVEASVGCAEVRSASFASFASFGTRPP